MDVRHYDPQVLVNLRNQRGLLQGRKISQAEVAQAIGKHTLTVIRAETGRGVTIDVLHDLCAYYGYPIKSVLRDTRLSEAAA